MYFKCSFTHSVKKDDEEIVIVSVNIVIVLIYNWL